MKLDELKKLTARIPHPATREGAGQLRSLLEELGLDPDCLYQELEMSHRYFQLHRDTSWNGNTMNLHSHTFFELLCCRTDCGAEYLVGTQRFRLRRGDIIFVPPGVSHRPILPEAMQEPYVRDVLWFSADFVNLIERLLPQENSLPHLPYGLLRTGGTRWESLSDLLHYGVTESERKQTGWETAILGTVTLFLSRLKRAFLEDTSVSMAAEKPELLDRAMAWLEAHQSRRFTLEDMARQLYVSKSTLSQTFHHKLGVSVHRYLTQRRLISAKSLILEGIPLEEVGARVGFTDYSTFYRAFRQEYGISPRQFRKLQKDPGARIE